MFRLARFGMVGCLNTAVDIGLYLLLRHHGVTLFVANIISTTAGLIIGFTLHSTYTFRSRLTGRRALYFAVVTLSGLWILQPVIIACLGRYTQLLVVPKLLATLFTLAWNYTWYSRRIYRRSN